ncbi:MAG: c-type cytochrome [Amaricoccus sp.]
MSWWRGVICAACLCAGMARGETLVERGDYLVRGIMACGACHSPSELSASNREFTGRLVGDGPDHSAWAPNLTSAGAIAAWSDAAIGRAIREGIRPDGTRIGRPMPIALYRGLSDQDLAAIVAFLRTLPPVEGDPPGAANPRPPPASYGFPVGHVAEIPRGPTAAYGAYLAGPVMACLDCHTPRGRDGQPLLASALGQGGARFDGPWGVAVAPALTADRLAGDSDAAIGTMIRYRVRPDGALLGPPMPYANYLRLTPEDLAAVIAYLRTVPEER